MGKKGLIIATGRVSCEFIENSSVQCGGDFVVRKAILNSDIVCGRAIHVEARDSGVIAGGTISCKEYMKVANLGFQNGNKTYVNIGVDWKSESSLRRRTHRLERLNALQESERLALRELVQRKKGIATEKDNQRKDYYQKRLVKLRLLTEKAQTHLQKANSQLVYNDIAKIFVQRNLFANMEIKACGVFVEIRQDMLGVAILGNRRRSQKIVSIESALEIEKDDRGLRAPTT
jgi:uncharacterized protein (DUF342 family)